MVIVASLLEYGDVFQMEKDFTEYKVCSVTKNYVYFRKVTSKGYLTVTKLSIEKWSKEKLFLIKDGWFKCPPNELKYHMEILVPEESKYEMLAD